MLYTSNSFCRLRQVALAVVVAGLAWSVVPAQTSSTTQKRLTVPYSQPTAPVGTSFTAESGNTPVGPDTRVAPGVDAKYKIGADDVLSINVWNQKEVSREVPVRPDGKISLPLIGDVQAAGLTPDQLQNELRAKFSKYLTNPTVTVIVVAIRSQRVNVLGQVLRPGTYPLIPPMGVIDAISAAGGLGQFAKAGDIYVLRTSPDGHRTRLPFNYKDVLKGKKGSHDILLQTRDTVVVP